MFSRDGCIRPVAKRLRPSNGAKPRTTFEKKLSILNGEVFFIDKDLLMGADHRERLPNREPVQCKAMKKLAQFLRNWHSFDSCERTSRRSTAYFSLAKTPLSLTLASVGRVLAHSAIVRTKSAGSSPCMECPIFGKDRRVNGCPAPFTSLST